MPTIFFAAVFGHTLLVKAILRHDVIDLEDRGGLCGSTILQIACFRLRKDVVRVLLEAGADPFSRDSCYTRRSSIYWAQHNGWDDLVRLMKLKRRLSGGDLTQEPCSQNTFDDTKVYSAQCSNSNPRLVEVVHMPSYRLRMEAVQRYVEMNFFPEEYKVSPVGRS